MREGEKSALMRKWGGTGGERETGNWEIID